MFCYEQPNLDIAEFGYKAEQKYCNLKEEQPDGENWYFFRNFKMALHRQDVRSRQTNSHFIFQYRIFYLSYILRHYQNIGAV